MAEDAYQLKNLEDIMDFDSELQYEKKPEYNAEQGIIHKDGKIFTTDYSKEETEIIVRDSEGVILDKLSSGNGKDDIKKDQRNNTYKNWKYTEET